MDMLKRRRGEVPEPEIELGPDGQPTARSWSAIERAARAGNVVSMANFGDRLIQQASSLVSRPRVARHLAG
jgi:hypothetical protein